MSSTHSTDDRSLVKGRKSDVSMRLCHLDAEKRDSVVLSCLNSTFLAFSEYPRCLLWSLKVALYSTLFEQTPSIPPVPSVSCLIQLHLADAVTTVMLCSKVAHSRVIPNCLVTTVQDSYFY